MSTEDHSTKLPISNVTGRKPSRDTPKRHLNPPGLPDKKSFGELVERAFLQGQRFDQFLRHVVNEEWNISSELLQATVKDNMDRQLEQLRDRKDFDPQGLPYALQRYLATQPEPESELEPEVEATPPPATLRGKVSHQALPAIVTIRNWLSGASRPDPTQIVVMASAFGLSVRQEHMLWKSVQGKRLTLRQVGNAIEKGDSVALGRMLVHASGFDSKRLASLIGVPHPTLFSWINKQAPSRISDPDNARRFAEVLTGCIDPEGIELQSWRLRKLRRDIADIMMGYKIEARPESPREAAASFRKILQEEYDQCHASDDPAIWKSAFSQFLQRVLSEWDDDAGCLNFINQNNSALDGYTPVSHDSFQQWLNDICKPRATNVDNLVKGAVLNLQQELKLWKMIQGSSVTAEEVKDCIASGNSAEVITKLIDASGIGHDRLLELVGINTSTLTFWTSEEKPRLIFDPQKADTMADLLLPLIKWKEEPPPEEEVADLRRLFLDKVTGRKNELFEAIIDALDHPKPHARLFHVLTDKLHMSNARLGETLGVPEGAIEKLKAGAMVTYEAIALELIELAGGGAASAITDAVDVLTRTRSPSELLALAEQDTISAGKVYAESCQRKRMTRKELTQTSGISNRVFTRFEDEGKPVSLKQAGDIADAIGYTGDERRRYIVLASGRKLEELSALCTDAEGLRCPGHTILQRICDQTGMEPDAIADCINVPAQDLANYLQGNDKQFFLSPEQAGKLIDLIGAADKGKETERLRNILIPNAARILTLMEVKEISRVDGLKQLCHSAGLTPELIASECGVPIGHQTNRATDFFQHPAFPNVLSAIEERLQLSSIEREVLRAIYDPAHAADEKGWADKLEALRKQGLGKVMQVVGERKQREDELSHPEIFLNTFDGFASHTRDDASSVALDDVRALLTGDPQLHVPELALLKAFKTVGKSIPLSSLPEEVMDKKTWRGKVFDAVNILLYQRINHCRDRLGLGGVAMSASEARQQRIALLQDPEGKRVLNAVMGFNNGMVMAEAGSLTIYPKYKGQDALLETEMWLGRDNAASDVIVGGLLDKFLQWQPVRGGYSHYASLAINHQVIQLAQIAKRESEEQQHSKQFFSDGGNGGDEPDSRTVDLDIVAHSKYLESIRKERDDPYDDEDDVMATLMRALARLPTAERKVLTAIFSGIMEGEIPTLQTLGEVAATESDQVRWQRAQQVRDSAYNHFVVAWQEVARPGQRMPVALKTFLNRQGDCDVEGSKRGR